MPIYEYYCKQCDGIFEAIRQLSQSSDPAPCPVCAKKGARIPPTSFAAFTMRDGYPRRIPDKGTYWHLGKEVKRPITGGVRMNEHPEINKPKPRPKPTKGEREIMRDKAHIEAKEQARQRRDRVPQYIERKRRPD
jgi:putative FmdB family regulatory protein